MRTAFFAAALLVAFAQSAAAQVRGRVVSAETRKPVTGAVVRDVVSGAQTVSDTRGEWRLDVGAGARIRVEHIAYVPADRVINSAVTPVVFALDESVTEVDAVVVTVR